MGPGAGGARQTGDLLVAPSLTEAPPPWRGPTSAACLADDNRHPSPLCPGRPEHIHKVGRASRRALHCTPTALGTDSLRNVRFPT